MHRLSFAMVFLLVACGSVNSTPPLDAPDKPLDAPDMPIDAPDTPIDAAPARPPVLVGTAKAHGANTASLTAPMTVPPGEDRFLIVTVGIGSACTDPIQIVLGVSYAAMPLARLDAISGTGCGPDGARSEQWRMVAPPVGTNDVIVQLSAPGLTVHVGALAFTGVNQASPVRASSTGSGSGVSASVTVTSAAGDLVVASVGQGGMIVSPGPGQNPALIDNVTSANTLDNTAASTAPGSAPAVTMDWSFQVVDEWQMVVSSLRAP